MSSSTYNPANDPAMMELFRQESESHTKSLTKSLLEIEKSENATDVSEQLMRSAHSIKGAARMVGIDVIVNIAHVMEDCFVAAQNGVIRLTASCVDVLLKGVDTISDISNDQVSDIHDNEIAELISNLEKIKSGECLALSEIDESVKYNESTPPVASNATDEHPMLKLFISESEIHITGITTFLKSDEEKISNPDNIKTIKDHLQNVASTAKLCELSEIHNLCDSLKNGMDLELSKSEFIDISVTSQFKKSLNKLNDSISALMGNKEKTQLEDIQSSSESTNQGNVSSSQLASASLDNKEIKTPTTNDNKPENLSIKISTQRINKLVGLAGESVVESQWARSHADLMLVYKRRQSEIINSFDKIRSYLDDSNAAEHIIKLFGDIQRRANDGRSFLNERLNELEDYDRRVTSLSERLNHEVLQTRMRPFSDCTHGFDRMVRDISRSLDKKIQLIISGGNTQVDREILNRIESPLNHLIRNSVDHGIESKTDRKVSGKPDQATIKVSASHNMGMLSITIKDDGRGVDMNALRERIVERKLSNKEMVKHLSDAELFDFLYLPGFSTRSDVTEISGRGVGLDVVHSTIQEMRGKIRTSSTFGKGISIQLLLPLTLSIIKSLLATIGGQTYVFPLARIESIHNVKRADLLTMEGKQYITVNGQHIGLIDSAQVLGVNSIPSDSDFISIIILSDRNNNYGLVVDKFIGERDISVHLLDPRLGKIKDVSAATILENGDPALIVDIEDMIRSIEILVSGERLTKVRRQKNSTENTPMKRVLVVDDSITVREVEKKLLVAHGYDVEVAVDGMDGWNTVHENQYDLIISDIDMPRMNGIEFVSMLKSDPIYRKIPVMIVSYKDRQEDREAGLQAGADYYLTKGSFHDESLIDAVIELIGEAN